MARIVKEYLVRRTEILDAARRLVYTKGYEQMTIQDILDELHISKGAFYHYFDSKQSLLDALVECIVTEGLQVLTPVMQDPDLPALEKLQRFFDTAARWKTAQKEYLIALLRVWYTDDNAIVRQKQLSVAFERIAPLLATIIQQGVQEGVFSTAYPEQMSAVVLSLFQSLGDTIMRMLLACAPDPECTEQIDRFAIAFMFALERVLGAPPGSIHFVDREMIREWVVAAGASP